MTFSETQAAMLTASVAIAALDSRSVPAERIGNGKVVAIAAERAGRVA